MTVVAVTGASGFIGRNLVLRLRELNHKVVSIPHQADDAALLAALGGAEVVFHLAGVNRPETTGEYETGNVGMTDRLVAAMRQLPTPPPVVYASSIQAAADNPYGRSKREAEALITGYAQQTSVPGWIFRLPNVFGKWCRPNYNSVVATFCHNVSRGLPLTIIDPAAILKLVYIDDVVEHFAAIAAAPLDSTIASEIAPIYETTVGDLAQQLQIFRDSRTTLLTGAVGTGFLRALHATYVSYLEPANFAYPLKAHSDPRGMFVEMLRTPDSGQFSFFTAHPGITRGGHYHHSKTEKFLVVQGHARFGFRHVLTDEVFTLETSGETPTVVETVPGWSHDITNIGQETLLVMLWANELFDPQRPDTVPAKVLPE
ncbi:NAD-dependent epimerase/dehydratase family protein [Devosia sp.]|uniref:UDP-2-acetamido-2,6-beta-L-arabino-hexul-4-ose reductase n=1 Tax=Devosia sp. TaxID=1871048 RepID=UPI0019EE336E|nr:NAD-dependent epimerase/dehydratase family protein [Devosia sp.]MBE0580199.1 NAD-dependent epimerase/dehydratase family protein [Devosia sp.]